MNPISIRESLRKLVISLFNDGKRFLKFDAKKYLNSAQSSHEYKSKDISPFPQ
jgi:hypothetical protein